MTEDFLIKKFREGDKDAMVYLFNAYYKALVLYAQNIIGTRIVAEDIAQGTMTKLWIDRKSIFIEISIKAYLIRAVKNRCLDYLKHEKIKTRYLNEFHKNMLYASNEDESLLLTDELSEKINRYIEELPKQCREIFKMSRFEDKKYKEIAEKLGISIKTVEAQMTKALKKLREKLKDHL